MLTSANSQRGVALLTVLLLVVSITIVAGSMLASQKIAIRHSGLLFNQDQLLQDIDVGQQLAMTIIRADNNLNETDSEQDVWAQPLPPFSLGSHSISAELRDEASRFNINNLYYNGATDSEALTVFQRLLTQLALEPEIAVAVLDWQDADSEVYKDGGDESSVYSQQSSMANKSLPNQPFVSVEQLIEVRGVDAEVLATLRPYLSAVPYYLPINVNTASPVLLAALMDGATSEQMRALTDNRSEQVLETIEDLWQLPPLSSLTTEQRQALTPLLAVNSQAFMALITATDGGTQDAAKQRFATVLISNTREESATVDGANNSNTAADTTDNKAAKQVKVVSQRLWAFRPSF